MVFIPFFRDFLADQSSLSAVDPGIPPVNQARYSHQVAALKPRLDTFMEMLSKAKTKCHILNPQDGRHAVFMWVHPVCLAILPGYNLLSFLSIRNLSAQLSRIIAVLSDSEAAAPPDGNFLLDWAQKILLQYESVTAKAAVESRRATPSAPKLSIGSPSQSHSLA